MRKAVEGVLRVEAQRGCDRPRVPCYVGLHERLLCQLEVEAPQDQAEISTGTTLLQTVRDV